VSEGAKLFGEFVGTATPAQIAAMDVDTLARKIGEARKSDDLLIHLTDEEIAWKILEYAREEAGTG
jgi:hypothetical protein